MLLQTRQTTRVVTSGNDPRSTSDSREELLLLIGLYVTGRRSNTKDNQCGASITDSSAGDASICLCERAEEGKQLETV
uniref:Uncharacterized protein n=1 Tax=Hyaloperonospora arabidopsidis (strain Emoy2) TaxID=559515 RepID=M4BBQ2_HYAAE